MSGFGYMWTLMKSKCKLIPFRETTPIEIKVSGLSFIEQIGQLIMKKTRYTDEQTIYALKQAKTGICSGEICRRMNIFETTFYIYIYGLRYFGK